MIPLKNRKKMKKVNHHYRDKPLKIGDIVHIHHSWSESIEIIIKEWNGAWKTFCIHAPDVKCEWEGRNFTLEKDSDRTYNVQHSKLLRILYGYE